MDETQLVANPLNRAAALADHAACELTRRSDARACSAEVHALTAVEAMVAAGAAGTLLVLDQLAPSVALHEALELLSEIDPHAEPSSELALLAARAAVRQALRVLRDDDDVR